MLHSLEKTEANLGEKTEAKLCLSEGEIERRSSQSPDWAKLRLSEGEIERRGSQSPDWAKICSA
jgi:hypothetical protein